MSYTLWRNDRLIGHLHVIFPSSTATRVFALLHPTAEYTDIEPLVQHCMSHLPRRPILQDRIPAIEAGQRRRNSSSVALRALSLICRRHHRLVHEDGWKILAGPNGEVRFYRPDGRPLVPAPPLPHITDDPVAALTAAHERAGLAISADSSERCRSGDRLGLDVAVLTLRAS